MNLEYSPQTYVRATNLLLARYALTIAAVASIALQLATAQTLSVGSVTISPTSSSDDSNRIQQLIDNSTGAVHFQAGVYKLRNPLHLGGRRPDGQLRAGNRTFTGEGSWDARYGSVLLQQTTGAAIFDVEGPISSVTIVGLTFDSAAGAQAKGIAAKDSTALLEMSTIRDSYFLAGLAECIDVPMVLTRIERNQFGVNGGPRGNQHRHIHSVYPNPSFDPNAEGQTNMNWIVGNLFRSAAGTESVLFESGYQLHLIGNSFESNDANTTLQINGMFQVVIDGNYFEGNKGDFLMHFANSRHSPSGNGNYIVRLQNNYYNLQRGNGPIYNKFIFKLDPDSPNRGFLRGTAVFMGYETGTHFTHFDQTTADLTDPAVAAVCNAAHVGIYLAINGPFYLADYMGTETNGCM